MTRKSDIEAEFNEKAEAYESNRLGPWYKAQSRLLLDHIDPAGTTVLDIGCGTGWLLREIVRTRPNACGIGVDLSERMVAVARALAREEGARCLEYVHGDWEESTTQQQVLERLPDGADFVVCASAFHYFARPDLALVQMREALTPGGRLLLLERAMDRSSGTRIWDLLHRRVIRDHVRFFETAEILTLLRCAGFKDARVLARIKRLFWHRKLHTSLVILSAQVEDC